MSSVALNGTNQTLHHYYCRCRLGLVLPGAAASIATGNKEHTKQNQIMAGQVDTGEYRWNEREREAARYRRRELKNGGEKWTEATNGLNGRMPTHLDRKDSNSSCCSSKLNSKSR